MLKSSVARTLICNSRVFTAKRALSLAARGLTRRASNTQQRAPFNNAALKPLVAKRGIRQIKFGDEVETVYERSDWPREKLHDYFKDDTFAIIGYGSQGYGQGLNLRDNGMNVVLGVRKNGASWKAAIEDGWVPGENLFEIEEAVKRGTYVMNLLSDAAQAETWSKIKPLLTAGKTLYFSRRFFPVFNDLTHVEPPAEIDTIMVAPKGSGRTVRSLFKEGRGITSPTPSGRTSPGRLMRRPKL